MITRLLPDRWEKIIHFIESRGSASVEEISQALNISPATVRRDLARINQRGLITRTRGGAIPTQNIHIGPTLAQSRKINPEEKEQIGLAAAKLVENNDMLVFDGGYTTYQVAKHLQASNLQIVTNSFDIVQAVAHNKDITIIMLGGQVNYPSGTTVGPVTEREMHEFCVDKAILGADAFSVENGLCSPSPQTAQTKKVMIRMAKEVILVADHSKLGCASLHRIAAVDDVSTLVTDDKTDPELLENFRHAGIEVIVAANEVHDESSRQ
jgi:DeoR family transcriptional regulator, fructose operon transcriptional repressor